MYANAFVQNTIAGRVAIQCGLGPSEADEVATNMDAVDFIAADLQSGAFPDVARLPISLTGAVTLTDPATVTFACGSGGPPGSVDYYDADIGAIQVAAVS